MLNDNVNGAGMRVHLSAGDWSVAVVTAAVVMLLLTLFPFPMPHPSTWPDLAVAAGLRVPEAPLPVLAPFFQRWVHSALGPGVASEALVMGAHAIAGLTAGCWYMAFRQLLEFGGNIDMADRQWNRVLCPALAAGAAGLVAFSESVWTASQTLTSAGVDLFLAAAGFAFFFRFLARGRRHLGFVAFFLFGVLAAETPYGLLVLVPVGVLLAFAWRMLDPHDDIEPAVRIAPIEEFPYALMVAAWVIGLGVTLAAADTVFRATGGAAASFAGLRAAWRALAVREVTPLGAVVGAVACFGPLAVAAAVYPRLTHPLAPKPVGVRVLGVLALLAALAQVADWAPLRYRTWSGEDEAVAVSVLPGLYAAAAGAAVALGAGAPAAMLWCHDTRLSGAVVRPARFLLAWAAVAFLLVAGHGRQCETLRAKLGKVSAHIDRTLESCKGRDVIRSQGRLDPILELRARRLNRKLTIIHE